MRGSKYGSRKFLLALLIVLLASVLLWFDKLTGALYATIIGTLIPAYYTANVTQRVLTERAAPPSQ